MSNSVSPLQVKAWALANAGDHVPGRQAYRDTSVALYRRDLCERNSELLARLDAQNDFLDAVRTGESLSRHVRYRVVPSSPVAAGRLQSAA